MNMNLCFLLPSIMQLYVCVFANLNVMYYSKWTRCAMDNKAWLWRKKSTEKTVFEADNINLSSKWNDEEIRILLTDKEELEKDLRNLNDHLTSALFELNAKDELVKKHAEMAREAVTSLKKAEVESISLKQELEEALHQRAVGEERLSHLDAALKECMKQLRLVQQDRDQRIHDAMIKTSKEFQKSKMVLEEKLSETSKRLTKTGVENSHLSKALLVKDELIEDLNKQKTRMETDLKAVMACFDSMERDNTFLKYEVRVLEKELEIRNEEREFNRRAADATHKQHLESAKNISKLESECQRLRVLIRKRLPGPAALEKMKNEVELLDNDTVETRRRRLSPSTISLTVGSTTDNSPDMFQNIIDSLNQQLHSMEEENKTLKESVDRKANELQLSHMTEESSGAQATLEPSRSSFMSQDISLASVSDIGSDDKGSCSESWACALVSELENFRNEKQKGLPSWKTVGTSDMNLMDDFLEMEKIAVVAVGNPSGCSPFSSVQCNPIETKVNATSSQTAGREVDFDASSQEFLGWLQHKLEVILDENRVRLRNPEEIIEDIRAALAYTNHPHVTVDAIEGSDIPNSYNSMKTLDKSQSLDSPGVATGIDFSLTDTSDHTFQSDMNKSICKIIELIDGIGLPSEDYGNHRTLSRKDRTTPTGYIVRVFQWKVSEVAAVLQQYVETCYSLLNGKADLNRFSQDTASALDWIVNHCFSIQDVSSMRDEIEKQYGWEESSRSENVAEAGKFRVEEVHMGEENRKLKDELLNTMSAKEDLEGKLEAATSKSASLVNQLRESEQKIVSLENELESLRESNGKVEEQIENYKLTNGDLDAQLRASRAELAKAYQNFSSLEAELENKTSCYEELESMCVELQLQLESVTKMENPNNVLDEENRLQTILQDLEISAASQKLAECQETILNLEKQIKALAAPKEATLFDMIVSTPTKSTNTAATAATPTKPRSKSLNRRSSLLDHMIAEDCGRTEKFTSPNVTKHQDVDPTVGSRVVVPSKVKQGHESLWRKMLWKRKRRNGKKTSPPR